LFLFLFSLFFSFFFSLLPYFFNLFFSFFLYFSSQVRKLREMMDSETKKTELAKAAQLYHDIETLHAECNLKGIDVVAAEMPWVQKARERGQEGGHEASRERGWRPSTNQKSAASCRCDLLLF